MLYKILKLESYGEGWEKVITSIPKKDLTLEQAKTERKEILEVEGSYKPLEVYIVV